MLTVTADGLLLVTRSIAAGENAFEWSMALPAALVGRREMRVEISVSRTIRRPPEARELGLAFGSLELR